MTASVEIPVVHHEMWQSCYDEEFRDERIAWNTLCHPLCQNLPKSPPSTMKDCHKRKSSTTPAEDELKRRKGACINLNDRALGLPPEIFSLVMPFLNPRQMLTLASTCTSIMSYVSYDLVIRSAVVLGGSHAATNTKNILESVQRQSICMPTPMRLLRLVNGKTCENKECSRKTINTRFGLFICSSCADKLATCRSWRDQRCDSYERLVEDDRVDKRWGSMVLREPFYKVGIGPLVTHIDIENMVTKSQTLDDFLSTRVRPDPTESSRLCQVFAQAKADKLILSKEQSHRRDEKDRLKVSKIIMAIEAIQKLLKTASPQVMEYSLSYDGTHCYLSYGMTQEIMKEILHAPSKITRKRLQRIADIIDKAYPMAYKHGLHDFSCFSDRNVLQAKLKTYLQRQFTSGDSFLQDTDLSGAYESMLQGDYLSPVLKRAFHWTFGGVPRELRCIIAQLIAKTCGLGRSETLMVDALCAGLDRVTIANASHWTVCERLYESGLRECRHLRPLVLEYKREKAIVNFLSTCNEDYIGVSPHDLWLEAKLRVVSKVFYIPTDFNDVKGWLLSKDWDSLRDYHQSKVWLEYKQLSWGLE